MDLFSPRIASQIDRLVLGINGQVGPRHGRVLTAIANELGLDSLKLIPHFADFLLGGPLRSEIAEARMPYAPAGTVGERMAAFSELGLVSETALGFEATPRFRPLLVAAIAAREDVVVQTWTTPPTAEMEQLLDRVIEAVPESHIVAVAHRSLAPASNRMLRTYDRLVTLRYVRQHDHVEAWRAEAMTSVEMKLLTPLWYREQPPDDPRAYAALERRGLLEHGRLNEQGRRLRERIEAETNRRVASTWSVLSVDEREQLIEELSQMPEGPPAID
jgi:hypothetical protein